MSDITRKSTGFLIDEYITATFKKDSTRISLLKDAIQQRLNYVDASILLKIVKLSIELSDTSKQCWDAQQTIYESKGCTNYEKIALAGITAQETNAKRNAIIRQIDTLLGEITVLNKTYE